MCIFYKSNYILQITIHVHLHQPAQLSVFTRVMQLQSVEYIHKLCYYSNSILLSETSKLTLLVRDFFFVVQFFFHLTFIIATFCLHYQLVVCILMCRMRLFRKVMESKMFFQEKQLYNLLPYKGILHKTPEIT